ncbi:MAG: hypothetical protein AAFZ04_08325 [Pseudomonadota bacterium]
MRDPKLPDIAKQGEEARLFPVLATTSKEGRTTSIVLACMTKVEEFGAELLGSVGQKIGKRATVETFTEVVFHKQPASIKERPDGLIVVTVGKRKWMALVEAKVGNNDLNAAQIERYRALAKENGIDCVITLSNQFATAPDSHPLEEVRKSRSRVPVYHWSWRRIQTAADLLLSGSDVADADQRILLYELARFLSHESAGVRGFDRMPREWTDLNKTVTSGGAIGAKSIEAQASVEAWHQETRDLALILSRMTSTQVQEKLPRKHVGNPALRLKDDLKELRETCCLRVSLIVPDATAPIEIIADLNRRNVEVGMTLRAPEDKKSTAARVNWLLRQIKSEDISNFFVRLHWPGSAEPSSASVAELREDIQAAVVGKSHLVTHSFDVYLSERLGGKFTQQTNFISELERMVPHFYGEVGSDLSAWVRRAPKLMPDPLADDESPDEFEEH